MPVLELGSSTDLKSVVLIHNEVLVDFYSDWCTPCKTGAPLYEEYSNNPKYSLIKFVKINIDNLSDEDKEQYNISSIPYLKKYKNNMYVKDVNGLTNESLDFILLA